MPINYNHKLKFLSQEILASKLIYVGHLAKGVYVYRVIEDDDVSSGKIVIE